MKFIDDGLFRREGSLCSYDAYLTDISLSREAVDALLKDASSCGLSLDAGEDYIEFEFKGRDSNQFVVDFLRRLAASIGSADGEIRCEITIDEQDPLFEFFQIRDRKLFRQRARITREDQEDVTCRAS
jgi:hypothetical protein